MAAQHSSISAAVDWALENLTYENTKDKLLVGLVEVVYLFERKDSKVLNWKVSLPHGVEPFLVQKSVERPREAVCCRIVNL